VGFVLGGGMSLREGSILFSGGIGFSGWVAFQRHLQACGTTPCHTYRCVASWVGLKHTSVDRSSKVKQSIIKKVLSRGSLYARGLHHSYVTSFVCVSAAKEVDWDKHGAVHAQGRGTPS